MKSLDGCPKKAIFQTTILVVDIQFVHCQRTLFWFPNLDYDEMQVLLPLFNPVIPHGLQNKQLVVFNNSNYGNSCLWFFHSK